MVDLYLLWWICTQDMVADAMTKAMNCNAVLNLIQQPTEADGKTDPSRHQLWFQFLLRTTVATNSRLEHGDRVIAAPRRPTH